LEEQMNNYDIFIEVMTIIWLMFVISIKFFFITIDH